MIINLSQAMLHGRGLDECVHERRAQIAKNKIGVANNQTELKKQQINDYAIFKLSIRAIGIQSGWQDAF
jgi:hypothetical protein